MIKTPVKFQKDRFKTVGGVALTRYLLQTRNHAPRITHHTPRKAEYYVPSLFFEKAGDNNYYFVVGISTNSSTHFLLTLASERYTIYFDIGRKPGQVCI